MEKKETARLFIAIDLPKDVQEVLAYHCNSLANKNLFVGRCTKPESFHLTLKFLGDILIERVPEIDAALKTISCKPCEARLGKLDVLPSREKIRILFVSLICDQIENLAAQVEEALSFGFEREERAFKSHVTIARVKAIEHITRFLDMIDQTVLPDVRWIIDSFTLKKSTLVQDGPLYETVARYPLD